MGAMGPLGPTKSEKLEAHQQTLEKDLLMKFSSRPDLSPQKVRSHYLTAFKAFNLEGTIIVTVGPPCARQIIPSNLQKSHKAKAFHCKNSSIPFSISSCIA